MPAGAFQTPRVLSVRAKMPATKPQGGKVAQRALLQRIGRPHPREIDRRSSARRMPVSGAGAPALSDATVASGSASTIRNARRVAAMALQASRVSCAIGLAGHADEVEESMRSVMLPTPKSRSSSAV